MAADVKFNQEEFLALDGLPLLYRWTYIEIRKHMNFTDGVVGRRSSISLGSLSAWLEVDPHPGRKSSKPSKNMVRSAIDALIKKGLLVNKSVERHSLIFECVLASSDKSARKKVHTASTQQVPTVEPSKDAEINPKLHTAKKAKVHTHPVPRKPYMKTSSSSAIAAAQPGHDDDEYANLIYPEKLLSSQRNGIKKLLSGLGSDKAQLLLDELAGQMAAKEIKNLIGYMQIMTNQDRDGKFQPQRALMVQEGREQQERRARQIEESKKAVLQEIPVVAKPERLKQQYSFTEALKTATKNHG